jgi:superfamily II DNA or RNA helicase
MPVGQDVPTLTFIKQGNLLYISTDGLGPAPPTVFQILHRELSFKQREFLYGVAARDPITGQRRAVEVTDRRLYDKDDRGRLYTNFGFVSRCHHLLKKAGFGIRFVDWDKQFEGQHPRPERNLLDLPNVTYHFKFRQRQDECLRRIAENMHGLIHAVTGFGKMAMIVMVCLLFPKAKIHIITKRIPLVNKIVEFLTRFLPNVGQFGDGVKRFGSRITVFSAKSLCHSDFDADIVLADEAHELITDETSKYLAKYCRARMYALTATPTGRSDGTDCRLEAFFGPSIFYLPYWEAVKLGLVVPIRVEWRDVILSHNPAAGIEDPIERKRRGVWFNDERNDLIASDILEVPEDEQFLVLTDTLAQAVELYRRVRGKRKRKVILVYDKIDAKRFEGYSMADFIPRDASRMTPALKEQYRKEFESGEVDAISTLTWEVGIDAVYLQRLFVASPFRSEIRAQQAPGRASRINDEGKAVGIVRDYRDQFDPSWRSAAKERYRVYESLQWDQVVHRGQDFLPISS